MKVHHISDLHINHHVLFNENPKKWEKQTKKWTQEVLDGMSGEVLILAGDISDYNQQFLWVLEEAAQHFERVFYVPGNHDYYLTSKNQRNIYENSLNKIDELARKSILIPGVIPLHERVYTYKGVTFAGNTLWYDLTSFASKEYYKCQSNDSRLIFTGISYKDNYKILRDLSMDWYHALAGKDIDVFVSHFPPLHQPFSPFEYNECYVSPVPFLVGKHWIAGHSHVRGIFEKSGVTFHMNAYGYPYEDKKEDKPKVATFNV